jgi:hypothetical protein
MAITIINDSSDPNAFGRQLSRVASLFPGETVIPVGVSSDLGVGSQLEAAGNLVDILDSYETRPGIVLVNVAPRSGEAKKWGNGIPFCYFYYENLIVVSTMDLCLSLVKKLGLVETVNVMNMEHVLRRLAETGVISGDLKKRIMGTQFRSFEFMPRVARWLKSSVPFPSTRFFVRELPPAPNAVWYVDSFGNCKTTILARDFESMRAAFTRNELRDLPFYRHLHEIPDGEVGFVVGSSGHKEDRFMEVMVLGDSAAQRFNLKAGDIL